MTDPRYRRVERRKIVVVVNFTGSASPPPEVVPGTLADLRQELRKKVGK